MERKIGFYEGGKAVDIPFLELSYHPLGRPCLSQKKVLPLSNQYLKVPITNILIITRATKRSFGFSIPIFKIHVEPAMR